MEPQRDVHRVLLRQLGPRAMRALAPNRLLATRAEARAAVPLLRHDPIAHLD